MINPTCSLCHATSSNQLLYHSKLRYDDPGKIYQCAKCEFIYLWPQPTSQDLTSYYEKNYRQEYEDPPVNIRHEIDKTEAVARFERIQNMFKNYAKPQSILEIGSGSGAFLSVANAYLPKVVGVELDLNSRLFIENQLHCTVADTLQKYQGQHFDMIVMFHVLEHISNPVRYLQELKTYLAPHGKLIIEVPNINDALISLYEIEEFKNFYFCSAHLSYFSKATLDSCLRQSGLLAEISFVERYNLSNHLNWLQQKTPGGLSKEKDIFSENTKQIYAQDLNTNGISDTLWAIAYHQGEIE